LDVFPEANKKEEIVEDAEFSPLSLGRNKRRRVAFPVSIIIQVCYFVGLLIIFIIQCEI
jgi:uncharacterized membrane protein (DUF485 family)